eukprot:3169913-Lingulodinium_polyedra.AAC.1
MSWSGWPGGGASAATGSKAPRSASTSPGSGTRRGVRRDVTEGRRRTIPRIAASATNNALDVQHGV